MFDIQEELKRLPQKPGVYIMRNRHDEIIYVGKAINLRNRVRSYFRLSTQEAIPKVRQMAIQIERFEYIITESEVEALILEANLIKANKPRYNIALKDDKAYPYIKLSTYEDFPRLFATREQQKGKGRYFGPYTSKMAVDETLDLIHSLWSLRRCSKKLNVNKTEKPCLNYHIGKCKAPCAGLVTAEDYQKMVDEAVEFISGRHGDILKGLEKQMLAYSDELEFEKAAEIRDKLQAVRYLREPQKVDMGSSDQDIIAFARAFDEALVQVFFVRGGKMTGREHFMLNGVEDMTREEVMTAFVTQFYGGTPFVPKELILQAAVNDEEVISKWLSEARGSKVLLSVPQKGDKLRLIELAAKNAIITLDQFGEEIKREKQRTVGAMAEIAEALGIDRTLERIEAYDISNIQGVESVGSMVVFENGKPKRSDYRKFKIKGVAGANDYASMEEVLTRRLNHYKKEINEGTAQAKFNKLPDMFFIDGGKGHVHVAEEVVRKMNMNILVCGMVKDDRHRTRGLFYQGEEISLPYSKEGFKLLTRIQDEVHRFAIEYHRKLRQKGQVRSVLDDIKGIGAVRRRALIRHFGDITKIRTATKEELMQAENMNAASAEAVYSFFHAYETGGH